ncbi:CRISPR-associated protein Cas4 [Egibacter rhizosphaerae]|uniref:CRISPR-associated exonuclease Cas4 n=1 Tax=Egibacter rhizosphaerae TaxID=1670831 RepID=A0A411YEM2_9ACTN|nr:CRISPR-associated protein Cas4 [Egibacter rhizosphaerae]QBI19646.1 CRISPR-associated protein Cas4 [Egibacter rhizosphaerae]
MLDPEPLPISALEHWVYCPRQCAFIHVEGLWQDNPHTVRGTWGHRRPDTGTDRVERGRRVLRGVPLHSHHLGLIGRADVVEVHRDGTVVPVEYKVGGRHGDTAEVQLCAEALCLEEMTDRRVPEGALWHSGPRRRTAVPIDEGLRARTRALIDEVRAALAAGRLPPAVNDARCAQCQFLDQCLPSVIDDAPWVARYLAEEVFACGS